MRKNHPASHYTIIATFFLLIILTIGVFITVNQTQTTQILHSHAALILSPTSPLRPLSTTGASTITQDPNQPTNTPPIASDMIISVSVKIPGIGQKGNKNPKHKTRRVTAYVYGTGSEAVATGIGFLPYDGSNYFTGPIHLGKLSEGSYFIKLVSDNTLQVLARPEFQTLLSNRINTIPPVTLYQGDMNRDNVLNLADYNAVLPCFQDPKCQTAGTIDFNDDGKADVTDYNLLLQSFEVMHGN